MGKLLILPAMALVITGEAYGRLTGELFEEGKVWITKEICVFYGDDLINQWRRFEVRGDTVINGIQTKIVHCDYLPVVEGQRRSNLKSFVFERDGIAYIYSEETNLFEPLLDFTLQKGDIVAGRFRVEDVYSETLSGLERRVIKFNSSLYWIEGIGTTMDYFYMPYERPGGWYDRLVNCYQGKELIYSNGDLTGEYWSCFREGTEWETLIIGTQTPEGVRSFQRVRIEGLEDVFGWPSMKLWELDSESPEEPVLIGYVRRNDDRVYFLPAGYTPEDLEENDWQWYLLYDFGLTPGEGRMFYSPYYTKAGKPLGAYLECVSVERDSAGREVMTLREYDEEGGESFGPEGKWIKGIGSLGGVLFNNGFSMCGVGSQLLKVTTAQGKVEYERTEASVKAMTAAPSPADDTLYDLTGRRVERPVKGSVYVRQGKKVVF